MEFLFRPRGSVRSVGLGCDAVQCCTTAYCEQGEGEGSAEEIFKFKEAERFQRFQSLLGAEVRYRLMSLYFGKRKRRQILPTIFNS